MSPLKCAREEFSNNLFYMMTPFSPKYPFFNICPSRLNAAKREHYFSLYKVPEVQIKDKIDLFDSSEITEVLLNEKFIWSVGGGTF